MGSNVTPDQMRGFIAPIKLTNNSFWDSETTITEETGRSGIPERKNNSVMVLQTSGLMSDNSTYQIKTARAGHVGIDGTSQFQYQPGTSGDWYGRDSLNVLSNWESVIGSAGIKYIPRDVLQHSTGSIFVACEKQTTTATPQTNEIVIIKRDTAGSTGSPTSLYSSDLTLSENFLYAGLCELEDKTILCIHWVVEEVENKANMIVHRSDENGENWSLVSTNAIPTFGDIFPLSVANKNTFGSGVAGMDLSRVRIAAIGGQVLLLLKVLGHNTLNSIDRMIQMLSTNNGLTFEFVTENTTNNYIGMNLSVINNSFALSYIKATNAEFSIFDNPSLPADSLELHEIEGTANIIVSPFVYQHNYEFTMWSDTDGQIYSVFAEQSANGRLFIKKSIDGGLTWYKLGGATATGSGEIDSQIFWPNAANIELKNVFGCSQGGEGVLFHTWDTVTSTYENTLGVLQLGGYTNLSMPPRFPHSTDFSRCGWSINYIGIDLPVNQGWTKSGLGTETLNFGNLELTAAALTQVYYQRTITDSLDYGSIASVHLKINSGTVLQKVLSIQISDGVSVSYHVSIRASSTTLDLYDAEASATIGTSVSVDTTEGVNLLIAVENRNVYAWYQTGISSPRTFVEIDNTTTLTAGTQTTSFVRFGAIGAGVRNMNIYNANYSDTTRTGLQLALGQTVEELWSRPYPANGFQVKLDNDIFISTRDGATQEGDEWEFQTRYDYPKENILYSVAPNSNVQWRSKTQLSGMIPSGMIAFYVDETSKEKTLLANDIFGITLSNINFLEFNIKIHDGVSWTNLYSVSNHVFDGSFDRIGSAIKSTAIAASSDFPYLFFNECENWYVELKSDAGAVPIYRKIKSNSEGPFSATTSKFSVLQLAGIDGTEPTSGNCKIIPNSCTVIINTLSLVQNWREIKAIGIEIASQYTYEQYFKIGLCSVGPLVIPGKQYSRGRSITENQSINEVIQLDGTKYTSSTGNKGRTIKISWSEGVDSSNLYTENVEPDYWTGDTTQGQAISNYNDTPELIQGLYRYLEGGVFPLVYIPSFEKSSAASNKNQMFNRYSNHVLAQMFEPVQITNVLGDEFGPLGYGEVFRVSSIILDEIR